MSPEEQEHLCARTKIFMVDEAPVLLRCESAAGHLDRDHVAGEWFWQEPEEVNDHYWTPERLQIIVRDIRRPHSHVYVYDAPAGAVPRVDEVVSIRDHMYVHRWQVVAVDWDVRSWYAEGSGVPAVRLACTFIGVEPR